jgi:RNA polymerase sigma factor (sigma-70 family)
MGTINTADGDTWDEDTDDEAAGDADAAVDDEGDLPSDVPSRRSGTRPVRRLLDQSTTSTVAEAQRVDRPCETIEDVYERFDGFVARKLDRSDIGPESADGIHLEVFLTMNEQIDRYTMAGIDSVEAMLTTITGNLVCNYLRTQARRPRVVSGVDMTELASGEPDPERRAAQKELVHTALGKMPEDAAMLILRIDLQGMTHEEVADELGCPTRTVQTRHRRARARFQQLVARLLGKSSAEGDA